jgi:predicted site-specific integrase-resolvase
MILERLLAIRVCLDYTKQHEKIFDASTPVDPARTQAVIYACVSSKEQEKEGFSIPAQLKLLKDYAASNGFTVAQEYVDVETAKQTGRTAFGEMLLYLKAHPSVRVMLVEKTDRLYRNLKDWVTEPRAVSRRKRSGRCVCSATLERNWSLPRKGMRIHV